jgi:hypothetical protein
VHNGDSTPCPREPEIVRELFEDFDRLERGLEQLALGFRMRNAEPPRALEKSVPMLLSIARCVRSLDQPIQQRLRACQFADGPQGVAQLPLQCELRRLVIGEQRDRTVEQIHGGRHIVACIRTPSCSPEHLCRTPAELSRVLVERSQLLAIPERLLVVVTDDLVQLTRGSPGRPVGESLMEERT